MLKNTIGDLLLYRTKQSSDLNSVGKIENRKIRFLDFKNYHLNIEKSALGLKQLTLNKTEKVAILSQTRIEWNIIDVAIMSIGAITVPIYPSYTDSEIEYILKHAEIKILIVEDNTQLDKVRNLDPKSLPLEKIIIINGDNHIQKESDQFETITYEKLSELGTEERESSPDSFQLAIQDVSPEDIATIVYTSGTTGTPKGAMISQSSFIKVLKNVKKYSYNSFDKQDRFLTFLPLSHVLGRCESFFPLIFGCEGVYAESIDRLLPNIELSKPTLMVAVPRIFEKIYEKVQNDLEKSEIKKLVFHQALKAANDYFSKLDRDLTPSSTELIKYQIAKKSVFNKIYNKFGGKIRFFISGGAPLSPEIIQFLRAANLTVLEGYGLTETVAPCCVNPMHKQMAGTVGRPIGDVQIKFSPEGEILIKSEALFSGYYKNVEETKKVLTPDGWFCSGDLGEFTEHGYLKITGRKKDIIITSGGKNIAPQKIEGSLNLSPIISNSVIAGDQQKYLTALIFIDIDSCLHKLKNSALDEDSSLKDYSESAEVNELIQNEVDRVNETLASFETIKKFTIIATELTIDNYLTPSLKVKKKVILNDFKNEIEAMYQ